MTYLRVELPAATRTMPPNNLRFLILGEALRRLEAGGDGAAPLPWACAFSMDLSDVDVMRVPPCAALAADELVIGTDGCSKKLKVWLEGRATRSGMLHGNATSGGGLRRFLGDRRTRCIYTSALVGGRREAFLPALRAVAAHIEANWAQRTGSSAAAPSGSSADAYKGKQRSRPPDFYWGEDMVAWNEVALSRGKGQVLAGYPGGPTNLPMYGGLAPNHFDSSGRQKCGNSEACRHAWLQATHGMHWFAHKASHSQRYWVMEPECRRPRKGRAGRLVGGGAWKLPNKNCTLPHCTDRKGTRLQRTL